MLNKFYVLGAVLTGCALAGSALALRRHARRQALLQHRQDLRTWEGEGGKAAPRALSTTAV